MVTVHTIATPTVMRLRLRSATPEEPTEEEIHGIDVLSVDDATRELWKAGVYAESAMGCTGPVVKVPRKDLERAEGILKSAGYL